MEALRKHSVNSVLHFIHGQAPEITGAQYASEGPLQPCAVASSEASCVSHSIPSHSSLTAPPQFHFAPAEPPKPRIPWRKCKRRRPDLTLRGLATPFLSLIVSL